ncbi:hypothetical protein AVENP_2365 [Arcobacter venerupis]|jgi:hypothetical protein|uniref:Uncharacterized protein n=1 Tax=Arcobacter venerupis TaxID=1054033 RepID=A0AAE7B9Z4_9BACT|nr:hypothetical protein [Arcobacter venerupis]QKF67891.1 hypothetical protein AVENP_2365 [Arcobacter venerupis]RWS49495.1 hypothetical protein CKA56_08930 [Arcobacter venerupis]
MSKFDEEQIKGKLKELEKFYNQIRDYYSIKEELIKSDEEESLRNVFENEIALIKNNATKSLSILEKAQEIDSFLNENNRFQNAKNLLSDETINQLEDNKVAIQEAYTNIFETQSGNLSDVYNEMYEKTKNAYNDLFVNKTGEKVKIEILNAHIDKFEEKYASIISNEKSISNEVENLHKDFKTKQTELDKFYKKIFGDEEKEINSLKDELELRLSQLKETEIEARKVINLSSDAGLGGGFFQKAKEAKINKYISLGVFVFVLIVMGCFNFNTIDFKNLKEIDLISITVRFMINAPFIWIATVANLNLNKYARLEQEYSHKESLAKSFERYKTEIEKLNDTETVKSKELLVELMTLNLEAFKLNPSLTMDGAKSDMDLLEKIKSMNLISKP